MSTSKRASNKEIFGWSSFDFANSAYTTVIVTVIFGPIFTNLIVPSSGDADHPYAFGNALWASGLAISYVIVALLGPFLGAMSDFSAHKKKFLFCAYLTCVIATACLWFVKSQELFILAFVLLIVSNFGFSLSENFVSSFLPFLGPKDEVGKISGYAWAFGYFGGILSVVFVRLLVGESTPENFSNLRWIGPLTALFFLIAAIPTFLFLKEPHSGLQNERGLAYINLGCQRLMNTIKNIGAFRDLCVFLAALFFALAALYIIISFTFIYGKQEIGLSHGQEALAFILTNLSAALGAFVFGYLQDHFAALKTFMATLILWITSIALLFYIREITSYTNYALGSELSVQAFFIFFASIAGLGLGATQSAGRTMVALFSPESKAGEFFGFWGIASKASGALGLFTIAWLQNIFGLHKAILVMAVFFGLSLVICFFVNEKRGIQNARNYTDNV